jgi:hypothetical protein
MLRVSIQDLTKGNAMKRSTALTSLLLSMGLLSTGAQSAELAPADRVTPLSEIAEITFNDLPGSPQEAELAIARTATNTAPAITASCGWKNRRTRLAGAPPPSYTFNSSCKPHSTRRR